VATFATINDIQEYEPDILNYGLPSFDDALNKAQADVERYLRIHWWPTMQIGKYDITIIGTYSEMDATKLTDSQLTRATVYCALGYYIYPRLSKFEPEMDVFQIKLDYYKKAYAEEIGLVIRDGVEYDLDNDNVVSDAEKVPNYFLRLKR
jgi:hypothetical protein